MNFLKEPTSEIKKGIKTIKNAPDVETIRNIFKSVRDQLTNINALDSSQTDSLNPTSLWEDELFVAVMERHQQLTGTSWTVENADLATQMPSQEEILSALKSLGILNEQNKEFYALLAYTWAEKNFTATDLVSSWDSALKSFFESLPSNLSEVLSQTLQPNHDFSKVLRAVCSDPVIMQAALDLKKSKDAKNNIEFAEAVAKLENMKRYQQLKKILNILTKCLSDGQKVKITYDQPNHYHGQTADGFFLELSYNVPSKLWTPWGYILIKIHGSKTTNNPLLNHKIQKRFKAKFFRYVVAENKKPEPVYSLFEVDKEALPSPCVRKDKSLNIPYGVVKTAWNRLKATAQTQEIQEGNEELAAE